MARPTRAQKRAANRAAFRAERGGRGSRASLYAGDVTMNALAKVQKAWKSGDERWLETATIDFERSTGQQVPHTYRRIPAHMLKRNPKISFKTCHGKKVTFHARGRKKGRVPKHLKKYLFKRGHKPKNRCGKRPGRAKRRR